MTIAEATWIATALLHRENADRAVQDFSVAEIKEKAKKEGLVESSRSGLSVHVSKHCVANKSADPATHRMLFKTVTGRRRLFRLGDEVHPDRVKGKIRPAKDDLPEPYQPLVDWYDSVYCGRTKSQTLPTLEPSTGTKGSDFSDKILRIFAGKVTVDATGAVPIPEFLRKELKITGDTLISAYREGNRLILQPINEDFIRGLRGSLKGTTSVVEDREREHRIEKDRS